MDLGIERFDESLFLFGILERLIGGGGGLGIAWGVGLGVVERGRDGII